MQHWFNRVINFRKKEVKNFRIVHAQNGRRRDWEKWSRVSCQSCYESFFNTLKNYFNFPEVRRIESQKNTFTFHFTLRTFTASDICNNGKASSQKASETRMSFDSIEFLCQISSLSASPKSPRSFLKHMSSTERKGKEEKFLFVIFPFYWMENLWNDLWDLLQLIIKVWCSFFFACDW